MTQNKVKIAVTGGIGSGKSSVCNIIAEAGFPVFSCDAIYSELLNDGNFVEKIASEFDVLKNGLLDKKALAEIVFKDEVQLKKLNAITHPTIMKSALDKMDANKLSFCEVPLLFEGGFEKLFDGVIVVLREKSERLASVSQRDNISVKDVILRQNSQINYDNCDFAKYYVIHNNGNLNDLKLNTLEIIEKITN